MAEEELTDEQAIMKIATAMNKETAITQDEKQNVHTFLFNVVTATDSKKVGNLRDDKEMNELGVPTYTVRGSVEMGRIAGMIMGNEFFSEYFNKTAEEALSTSLSREGFIIKQATTQTKQVADITRRKKSNKGWFKNKTEETGGDTTQTPHEK